jgi:poly(3-hydroxybutyrate) depolymerase
MLPLLLLAATVARHAPESSRQTLECGAPVRRELHGRSYLLRLPAGPACTSRSRSLPLGVLIHCFGCHAAMEVTKYAAEADARGMALVAPEGIASSFNAPHCCGEARRAGVDDVGFVDAVAAAAAAALAPWGGASGIFLTGFSNGGFLASHLADPRASGSRTRWAAVAPVAGHEYAMHSREPLPVAVHHCINDGHVNASGCCAVADGPGSTCCCGIEAHTCVSHQTLFEHWHRVNRCRSWERAQGPGSASCLVGVGCEEETSLCMHDEGCYHSLWSRDFPATGAVLDFFLRHLPQAIVEPAAGEEAGDDSQRRNRLQHSLHHQHEQSNTSPGRTLGARRGLFSAVRRRRVNTHEL